MSDKKTVTEKAHVMLAFDQGKKIRVRGRKSSKWIPCPHPSWDWYNNDYEVVPEPLVVYVNQYADGPFGPLHSTCGEAKSNCVLQSFIRTIRLVEDQDFHGEEP